MRKIAIVMAILLSTLMLASVLPKVAKAEDFSIVSARTLKFGVSPARVLELTPEELDATPANDPVPFNVDMVNAENVGNDGSGIYVAVLDTGLLSNWQYFFPPGMVNINTAWGKGFTHNVFYVGSGGNFSDDGHFSYGPLLGNRGFITHDVGNPNPPPNPFSTGMGSGHGTHMTSIITGYHFRRVVPGQPPVDTWIQGVAPKVTIIPVLVLDDWLVYDPIYGKWLLYTGGTWEMVAAGIRYIGDLAESEHVKIVINMSLGGDEPSSLIEDAINYAISKGVVIVASAGNRGYDGMGWPGAYPQVISAAAGWTQDMVVATTATIGGGTTYLKN